MNLTRQGAPRRRKLEGMTEFQDLMRRFETLECWDLNQFRGRCKYECGGLWFTAKAGPGWREPHDAWLQANPSARAWLLNPNNDLRRDEFLWESPCCLAPASRGWNWCKPKPKKKGKKPA